MSAYGRAVTPHAGFPDQQRCSHEEKAGQRGKALEPERKAEDIRFFQYGNEGEVADATERDNKDEDSCEPAVVNGKRPLCDLNTAVGERVDYFQTLSRPEAESGLHDQQTGEDEYSTGKCEQEQTDFSWVPGYTQSERSPDQDYQPLEQSARPDKLKIVAEYLQDRRTRTQQAAIEFTADNLESEHVKTASQAFRDCKGEIDQSVEHGYLGKSPSSEVAKTRKKHPDADKVDEREQEIADQSQYKRDAVLKLASEADADISKVKSQRVHA